MTEDIRSLFRNHDAFYEVSPYYLVFRTRRVQAGFDVDVYAARTDHAAPFMPPPDEYTRGGTELAAIAKRASLAADGACSVSAYSFPSSVTFGVRGHSGEPAAMFRIRIALSQLDRAVGSPESQALAEVERQLKAAGIVRR